VSAWPNTVAIGDFVADLDGTDFRVTATLTGWNDAPAIRSAIEEKAQQDGAWDSTGLYGPRVIGVDGVVDQLTHADAMAVADALTALSPRSTHEFIVDNEAVGPRSALVRVTQGAVLEWLNNECFTYSLQLKAPDPLKYGPQTFAQTSLAASAGGTGRVWPRVWPTDYGVPPGVTPGAITLANAGTASYHPRLRIDGPVPNPVVTMTETGDWIRYNATLAAGNWLDIDCRNRAVLLNGNLDASHKNLMSSYGAWLAVPVGGGSLSWTADAADPDATLHAWGYEGAWS
jgi:hypothetical protein